MENVGDFVGLEVLLVGDKEGDLVSSGVVGPLLGENEGGVGSFVGGFGVGRGVDLEGDLVGNVGDTVGLNDADVKVGPIVGAPVRLVGDNGGPNVLRLGASVGGCVGEVNVGTFVGLEVVPVGDTDGVRVSSGVVGPLLGAYVGRVGLRVGDLLGLFTGTSLATIKSRSTNFRISVLK